MAEIVRASTLPLSDDDACVATALWDNRDTENRVRRSKVEARVTAERDKHGYEPLEKRQIDRALDNLKQIKAIEESEDGQYLIITEPVRPNYFPDR